MGFNKLQLAVAYAQYNGLRSAGRGNNGYKNDGKFIPERIPFFTFSEDDVNWLNLILTSELTDYYCPIVLKGEAYLDNEDISLEVFLSQKRKLMEIGHPNISKVVARLSKNQEGEDIFTMEYVPEVLFTNGKKSSKKCVGYIYGLNSICNNDVFLPERIKIIDSIGTKHSLGMIPKYRLEHNLSTGEKRISTCSRMLAVFKHSYHPTSLIFAGSDNMGEYTYAKFTPIDKSVDFTNPNTLISGSWGDCLYKFSTFERMKKLDRIFETPKTRYEQFTFGMNIISGQLLQYLKYVEKLGRDKKKKSLSPRFTDS